MRPSPQYIATRSSLQQFMERIGGSLRNITLGESARRVARASGVVAALAVAVALVAPSGAEAQTGKDVDRVMQSLAHEPSAEEVVRAALRYFRVQPAVITELRKSARGRGMFPLMAAGYRFDDSRFARFESQVGVNPHNNDENTRDHTHAFTLGMVFDLRELHFNPAEVQVYGLIGVQRNLMLEVSRLYFLRRQLVLRFALKPPEDAIARAALQLRIDEFTAMLDVLTDGWFSATSRRRAAQRAGMSQTGTIQPE